VFWVTKAIEKGPLLVSERFGRTTLLKEKAAHPEKKTFRRKWPIVPETNQGGKRKGGASQSRDHKKKEQKKLIVRAAKAS